MEKVGNALKSYFKTKKLSQQKIAEKFGVSQVRVSKLISGNINFGREVARQWADEFGFSYSFLLTGEGSLFEEDKTAAIVEAANKDVEEEKAPDSAEYWKGKYEGAMQQVEMLREMLNAQMGVQSQFPKENVG